MVHDCLDPLIFATFLTLIVLRMSCYCKCAMTLPNGAMGWSALYDCSIS